MRKTWEEPRIIVQDFVANEYVAACYKIRCTTPNGNSVYYRIYEDTNSNGKLDADDELIFRPWGGFAGCNKWHKGVIRDSAPTANGFVTGPGGMNPTPVFYWVERLGSSYDYHVMTPGEENYETNPNAS